MNFLPLLFLMVTAAHAGARPSAVRPDACGMLTRSDVSAVQGEAWSDAKLTTRGETSQCFYQLPTFVKSISLDVTRGGGKAFWREHFQERDEDEGIERREKESAATSPEKPGAEQNEEARPPQRIRGVGDSAFWAGSRITGSLYVLKGDSILRVSIGGPGSEAQKIARSRSLARKALRRL